jgi:hypothetical protein
MLSRFAMSPLAGEAGARAAQQLLQSNVGGKATDAVRARPAQPWALRVPDQDRQLAEGPITRS